MMQFKKATKAKARLRLALVGPSGSGKTFTALSIATHLGARVAVVDTERGSASKYAGDFAFDALDLDTFSPQQYIDAIDAAAKAGYDVLVIDSLSHAWMGVGGALEQVDNAAKRSNSKNTFAAWRDVTPLHNAMLDAIIRAPMHVVATMRAKTEYVLEKNEKGFTVPRKVGIQPVQRDGVDYEFDVVADLNEDHDLIIGKTRCRALDGKIFRRAGKDVANVLTEWLTDGTDAPPAPASGPALERQLADSVTAAWPAWVAKHAAAMQAAASRGKGELLQAWADTNAEIAKLSPPSDYVRQVTEAKDAIKKSLNGAPTTAAS